MSSLPLPSGASSRPAGLFTLVLGSMGLAAVDGVLAAQAEGFSPLAINTVVFGLVLGLPLALGMAVVLPWSAYQLARLGLAMRGRLPLRLLA